MTYWQWHYLVKFMLVMLGSKRVSNASVIDALERELEN